MEVMKDKAAAMKAGLRMPDQEFCVNCHIEKGSHVAVTNRPPIDVKKGWQQLLHPLAPNPAAGGIETTPVDSESKGPKYAGAAECGKCHRGPQLGNQWSMWKLSAHSGAWAALGTAKAKEIAAGKGIADPQRSAECLKCHAPASSGPRLASFTPDEGVGCEACHGPGSDYMWDAAMRDTRSAKAAGLLTPTRETCTRCHQSKEFNADTAMKKIAHPRKLPLIAGAPGYKTPIRMALRPDSREVYVACEASDSVIVVDPAAGAKIAEIPVGGNPTGVTFTPNGRLAFVTNRVDDTVSVIDVAARKVTATLKTGNEPHGVLADREGKLLYVLNTSSNDISVFDIASLKRIKSLSAGNGPWSLAMAPDGQSILVTNMKSMFAPVREPFFSEVTVIDTTRAAVEDRVKARRRQSHDGRCLASERRVCAGHFEPH